MAATITGRFIQQLARCSFHDDREKLTDAQMLERFIELRDENAFELLMRRHAPMVLGVCRRILQHTQDAEDAFQAAFLVLAHKAGSVQPREMVANWLYGVAYRTALKARSIASRRKSRERQVEEMPEPAIVPQDAWNDLKPTLDRELNSLPDKYRVPIVLCDLEGRGHKEAAQQLGWAQGTLSGRLFRAREMLAKRLRRQGLAVGAAPLAALLSARASSAAVPSALMETTFHAANLIAAGQAATGLVSANVAALMEAMMKSILLTKVMIGVTLVAGALLAGFGTGAFKSQAQAQRERAEIDPNSFVFQERKGGGERPSSAPTDVHGVLKVVDAAKGTITVTVGWGREAAAEEKTFSLAKDAEVATTESSRIRGFMKEAKLSDLAPGAVVNLTLAADLKTVESIVAEGAIAHGMIKSVDAANNTITLMGQAGRGEEAPEKTYTVATNAEIGVDDGRGRRFSVKEAKLADLVPGSMMSASLSVDQKLIQGGVAEGPLISGTVKSSDLAKNSITIANHNRGGDAEEKTLELGKDVVLVVDDGKGRRLSVKEGKLSDIPPGSMVHAKLSANMKSVGMLRAEGPQLSAHVKSLDAGKGTITLAIQVGRGENPDERTLPVAKDVRILVDGAAAKLDSLKVDENTPPAQVRLSLDQKAVQSIVIGAGRSR